MKNILPLIGRILICAIFLISGVNKIFHFSATQQYMKAYGMPLTKLFLILAILMEISGGLSILLGFKSKLGALILIIFLIPTTIIFHTKFSDQIQMIMFMKNLAILGGLFLILSYGPGSISFDKK